MNNYKFVFNGKEYGLGEDNCSYVINDEEHPTEGFGKSDVIELLSQQETAGFDIAYYDQPCQNCLAGKKEKDKYFKFLEDHFFIFTKKGKYVVSSISQEYENTSLSKLMKEGSVDSSYIVSVTVCIECGEYAIEIEQCEV